jgi:rhodanese-related sulfurtransferase
MQTSAPSRAVRKTRFAVIIASFLSFLGSCQAGGGSDIAVSDLHAKFVKGTPLLLLDVRNPDELTGSLGALDGAVNIPLGDLERRMTELAKYQDREILVICRSGNRSGKAVSLLRKKGITAINVAGGMLAWRSAYSAANR